MKNQKADCDFRFVSSQIIIGDLMTVQSLLILNPDLITANDHGETLLHIAADNSQFEIAEFLLKIGAYPNAQSQIGETPLHLAVFRGAKNIVNLLLAKHANPNLLTNEMKSPLHYAAEFNESDVIKALLLNGASAYIKDVNGHTPADLSGTLSYLFPQTSLMPIISEATPTEENSLQTGSCYNSDRISVLPSQRLKTRRLSYKEELFDFLSKHSLRQHFMKLIDNGYDNLYCLALQMRTPIPLTHGLLKEAGIARAGDRSRLITHLEKLNSKITYVGNTNDLEGFLEEICMEKYLISFNENGYNNLQFLIENAFNPDVIDINVLHNDIKITKPGHKIRFIGIIQLNNQIQSSNSACNLL